MTTEGQAVAIAEDGSRIGIAAPAIADGTLRGNTAFSKDTKLPLTGLSSILLPPPHQTPLSLLGDIERMDIARGNTDTFVIRAGRGDLTTMPGILLRLEPDTVTLDYDGIESPLPRDKVLAVIMAKPSKDIPEDAARTTVVLKDGSTLVGSTTKGKNGSVRVDTATLGSIHVPADALAADQDRQSRVYLATLDPTAVEQTPFFDEHFPWQRDRAVTGIPLKLAGKTYERGIGMHARCRLVFPLEGKYRRFSAIAGIDESVLTGKARLVIRVDDGEPLLSTTLSRGDEPQALDLDVSGAESLVILVDFAPGSVGNGSRVDLCEAALIR
jgi:hypothetical protein